MISTFSRLTFGNSKFQFKFVHHSLLPFHNYSNGTIADVASALRIVSGVYIDYSHKANYANCTIAIEPEHVPANMHLRARLANVLASGSAEIFHSRVRCIVRV